MHTRDSQNEKRSAQSNGAPINLNASGLVFRCGRTRMLRARETALSPGTGNELLKLLRVCADACAAPTRGQLGASTATGRCLVTASAQCTRFAACARGVFGHVTGPNGQTSAGFSEQVETCALASGTIRLCPLTFYTQPYGCTRRSARTSSRGCSPVRAGRAMECSCWPSSGAPSACRFPKR